MSEGPFRIPKNWIWAKMGEIASVIGGGTPKTVDVMNYEGGNVPWLTPADLSGYTAKYIGHGSRFLTEKGLQTSSARMMPKGTVLFTSRAPIGYVAIAANPVCTNQGFKSFVLKEGILPDYVYWWLKGSKDVAEGLASGTTFLELSGAKAVQIPIPIAPLAQQESIVEEIETQFSRLDEAVANLKRVRANLKRYKAAVLKAAVEGKLTGQWRKDHQDVEPASKLLERILAERRARWEEAELLKMKAAGKEPEDIKWKERYKEPAAPDSGNLPQIPNGWQWYSSDQLFWFVTSGSRGWARYYSNAGPTFLRVGNLNHDSITLDLRDTQRVQPPTGAEGLRTRVEMDDVLISITADVGMIAVVPDGFGEGYINQHIALARPVGAVDAKYVAWYLASKLGQKQLQNLQRGATKAGLGLDDVRSTNVPLPPLLEQEEIELQIARRLSIVDEVNEEITINLRRAERLQQSILQRAFAGKLIASLPSAGTLGNENGQEVR